MAAKKLVPVRVKSGTYYHREKGKESADKVYKAHEENNNVLLLPPEEAKSLLTYSEKSLAEIRQFSLYRADGSIMCYRC